METNRDQNQDSSLAIVHEMAAAASLLHPVRLRILEELERPSSAARLARALDIPRQKVNYHLRELEKHQLVELLQEQRKGNCTERIVRATAKSYMISPCVLGEVGADPQSVRDRFSLSYLVALGAKMIRDLGFLSRKAAREKKIVPTLSLDTEIRFANPEARDAFAHELTHVVADLVRRFHSPSADDTRSYRFLVGAYPKVSRPNPPSTDADSQSPLDSEAAVSEPPNGNDERETR